MTSTDLVLLHAAFTWAMVGLIWVIQWVQYPGFRWVGKAQWQAFHEAHCARIAWVVAPLMLGELLSGVALLLWPVPEVSRALLGLGLGLLIVAWLSTALLSVPLHHQLKRHNPKAQTRLVQTHWIRTIAWTARGVVALLLVRGLVG